MNNYDDEIKKKELELLDIKLKKEQLNLNRRKAIEDFFSVATLLKIAYPIFIFIICSIFIFATFGNKMSEAAIFLVSAVLTFFLCIKLKIWKPRNSQSSSQTTATTQPEK